MQAIGRGEPVSDCSCSTWSARCATSWARATWSSPRSNIRKAYGLKVGSLLEFLRGCWNWTPCPTTRDRAASVRAATSPAQPFNAEQMRFLRAVQNVFVQKRRLNLADLYEPPLTNFGRMRWNAVHAGESDAGVTLAQSTWTDVLAFFETLT